MTKLEKLMQKNGVTDLKRKPDSKRIQELEEENADLRQQVEEQADALVELASIIVEGE